MKDILLKLEKIIEWIAAFMFFPLLVIIYLQAENNKQLMYDLNVSQTAFKIQSNQIAKGLCLPVLEMR